MIEILNCIPMISLTGLNNQSESEYEQSALALIAEGVGEERKYLLQWNVRWSVFNLIGGKVDNDLGDNGSFLRALCRELEEEMGLVMQQDCFVARELKHIFVRQHSRPDNQVKNYHFCVFAVEIFPDLPLSSNRPHTFARWLSTGRENLFVTAPEIARLRTYDNRPISVTTRTILRALNEAII